jgi:hypothetical protein
MPGTVHSVDRPAMTTSTTTPDTRAVLTGTLLPTMAGAAAIAQAIFQVAMPGSPDATFGSWSDWTRDILLLAYLLGSIGGVVVAHRHGLAPRAAVWLVGVGYGAIVVGVAIGLLLQRDPDWFMLLGGPGNLLAVAGFATWAVVGHRRRIMPVWAALWCGIGGVVAVFLSELGSSVIIGAFWIYLATRIKAQQ